MSSNIFRQFDNFLASEKFLVIRYLMSHIILRHPNETFESSLKVTFDELILILYFNNYFV